MNGQLYTEETEAKIRNEIVVKMYTGKMVLGRQCPCSSMSTKMRYVGQGQKVVNQLLAN